MEQTNLALPVADKTNIKNWAFEDLNLTDAADAGAINATDFVPEDATNAIIVKDGAVVFSKLETGVTVSSETSKSVKELNKLTALNEAKRNSGLVVTVAKNVVLSAPLYIVYLAKGRSLVHQTELTLEQGSEAEVVETFISEQKTNANVLSYIGLGLNAKLQASVINRLNGKGVVYYHRLSEVDKDATLSTNNFLINDSNIVFEDYTHLIGTGAEAEVATVALANEAQVQNVTVRVENMAPRSNGNIINYGIVKDTAHLAFNGIGKIHKGMKNGDNQQESRLLNLSRDAEAIANPFLLIDEGDITAGHAASIGQINPEQVYYLMSRGLSRVESEKMIVTGFLAPFANIIKDDKLKEQLLESIEVKLG